MVFSARRGTPDFGSFLGLLAKVIAAGRRKAAALVCSSLSARRALQRRFGKVPRVRIRSTRLAWAYLVLKRPRLGWPAHGMIGVDFDRARRTRVPDNPHRDGDRARARRAWRQAASENYQKIEQPNARKPLPKSHSPELDRRRRADGLPSVETVISPASADDAGRAADWFCRKIAPTRSWDGNDEAGGIAP